jgi:hypothetical protein
MTACVMTAERQFAFQSVPKSIRISAIRAGAARAAGLPEKGSTAAELAEFTKAQLQSWAPAGEGRGDTAELAVQRRTIGLARLARPLESLPSRPPKNPPLLLLREHRRFSNGEQAIDPGDLVFADGEVARPHHAFGAERVDAPAQGAVRALERIFRRAEAEVGVAPLDEEVLVSGELEDRLELVGGAHALDRAAHADVVEDDRCRGKRLQVLHRGRGVAGVEEEEYGHATVGRGLEAGRVSAGGEVADLDLGAHDEARGARVW